MIDSSFRVFAEPAHDASINLANDGVLDWQFSHCRITGHTVGKQVLMLVLQLIQ